MKALETYINMHIFYDEFSSPPSLLNRSLPAPATVNQQQSILIMKFSSTTLIMALAAIVVASPVAEKSNIEVALDFVPVIPSVEPGEIITVSGVDKKRSAALDKRQVVVDIWEHPNKGGRHEALISQDQKCCMSLTHAPSDLV